MISIFIIIVFLVLIFLPFVLIAFYMALSNLPGSKINLNPIGNKKKNIIPLPLILIGVILFILTISWLFSESDFEDRRRYILLLIGVIISVVKLVTRKNENEGKNSKF